MNTGTTTAPPATEADRPVYTDRLIAVDHEHRRYDGGCFTSYDDAIVAWREHDDARWAGKRPQVAFYMIRGVDHEFEFERPCVAMFSDSLTPRGRKHAEDAAKDAVKVRTPRNPKTGGPNGDGGWFYLGQRTVAQGSQDLAKQMARRGLIARDRDGRWHGAALPDRDALGEGALR
jgi:hypothetical protein